MAPEQARGQAREVGPATDVYALGAILYECLTGRPPFTGATAAEAMNQVLSEEPVAPTRLQRGLPRDLETICLKCLEKEPRQRYASAALLADDLGRYLGGLPIRARPVGPWGRMVKWARRRPAQAALTATGVLVLAAFLAGLLWHNRQLQAAVAVADHQRARADKGRRLARKAVDTMYTKVAEEWLFSQPHLERVEQEMLEEAAAAYEALAEESLADEEDPEMRFETAKAYQRLGRLFLHPRNNVERAREALQRAQRLFEQLAAESPDNPDYQHELGVTLMRLAYTAPDDTGPEEWFRNAAGLLKELVKQHPERPEYRCTLATCYGNWRDPVSADSQRWKEALDLALQAKRLWEELIRERPDEPTYRVGLSLALAGAAATQEEAGLFREAEENYGRAIAVVQELAGNPGPMHFIVQSLSAQGFAPAGTPMGALVQQLAAVGLMNTDAFTLADNPGGQPRYSTVLRPWDWRNQGAAYYDLARVLARDGRTKDALAALDHARRIHDKLAKDFPEFDSYRQFLLAEYLWQHSLLRKAGRQEEAEKAYARAREISDLVFLKKGVPGSVASDAAHLLSEGPDAKEKGALAVDIARAGTEREPERAPLWSALGLAHYRAGHFDEAVKALEKADQLIPGGHRPDWWFLLAMAHGRLGDQEKARQWYEQACRWLSKYTQAPNELSRLKKDAEEVLRGRNP
jgi:tetratricopeptide (TPR) repeat protein